MILIDFSQITVGTMMARRLQGYFGSKENQIKDIILDRLFDVVMSHAGTNETVVLCCDRGESWRTGVFPHYKAKRRLKQKTELSNWPAIVRIKNAFEDDMKAFSPWHVVAIEGAEGDDVIATLAMYTNEPIKIISGDRDFIQLHKFGRIKQYQPFTNHRIKPKEDHSDSLIAKILGGEPNDGIPNVLSPDDTFVSNTPQVRGWRRVIREMTEKHGGSVLTREGAALMIPEYYAYYARNSTLIDLTRTPQYLRNEIMREFEGSRPQLNALGGYLVKRRMMRSQAKWGKYRAFERFGAVQGTAA